MAKKNSSLVKLGDLKDLISTKMLLVYVAFFVAVYTISNSFAAAEAASNLLSAINVVSSIPGVRSIAILSAQNGSGEVGRATLIGVKNQTKVLISVANEPKGAVQPAHIHLGSCPNPGAVVYPLTNVVNGTSVTLLDVKLADIQKAEPLAVNLHKSATEIKTYVSCGNLK